MTSAPKKPLARTSEAAVALIRQKPTGETIWLGRWNDKWSAFHFVSGHRSQDQETAARGDLSGIVKWFRRAGLVRGRSKLGKTSGRPGSIR